MKYYATQIIGAMCAIFRLISSADFAFKREIETLKLQFNA